jgi:hypothetical protein
MSLTGLAPQTTYHFRARGVTAAGLIIFGNDQTFTTSAGVPINLPVATTISNDTCFNALQTITVAGLPNTFLITPTGHVTMIAGQSIRFLPGTLVQPGGYLHGHITLTNDFCSPTDIPVIAAQAEIPENPFISPGSFYRIYPNPSAGMFTLEFVSSEEPVPGNLEIYSMSGLKVLSADLTSEHKHEFSVALLKPGIYIVRIFSGGKSEMMKLVKL